MVQQRPRTYSVRTTKETEELLEKTYEKLIAKRLNANRPLMNKGEAFEELVRIVATQEGVAI